jgi:hypothetical protein
MKKKHLLYIPFILFSGLFLFLGYPGIDKGLESQKWPVAKGIIISSTVKTGHKMKSKSKRSYFPEVLYEYSVNNKKYRNTSITAFDTGGSANNAIKVMNKYNPQSKVDVHYDSENPSVSLLETGIQTSSIIFTIIGVISALAIIFLAVFFK